MPDVLVQSPVTTPDSIGDEEKFLVQSPYLNCENEKKWYYHCPVAIITISCLEIFFYILSDKNLQKVFRFEPENLNELWRLFTYMLIHDDWLHLILNILMQLLFATFLEFKHGNLRVLLLYLIGGATGVLGAACVHPDSVIGASAGVYALLISHLADILMNFEMMKYKTYHSICIIIIIIFDIIYNFIHILTKNEPLISWGAHIVGGITGLFIGLIFYGKNQQIYRQKFFIFFGIFGYICLLIIIIFLIKQIKHCTPKSLIRIRYIYYC